jgi:broad specificity phosphatase PhoE
VTLLLLIRHGETDWLGERLSGRMPDVHLNALGREKAEAVAAMLQSVSLDAIYSSPLERAIVTAEPTARAAGIPILADERLQEVEFGELTGKPFSELRETPIWSEVHLHPADIRYPGGENLQEVQNRVAQFIQEIHAGRESGTVAVFTHADTIRLALAHFLQMPLAAYHALRTDPASLSMLSLSGKAARIIGVNLPPGSPLIMLPGREPRGAK